MALTALSRDAVFSDAGTEVSSSACPQRTVMERALPPYVGLALAIIVLAVVFANALVIAYLFGGMLLGGAVHVCRRQ